MSFVIPHRVDDKPVSNFYEKIRTQGDASEFTAEAPGRQAVIPWSAGTYNASTGAFEYELPFSYLVNQNQLQVYWEITDYSVVPTLNRGYGLILNLETAEQSGTFNPTVHPYYRELSANKVAVYNLDNLSPTPYFNEDPLQTGPGALNAFVFLVPHTALPGSVRNRLIVENQGDNVGIELQGFGDGIALRSPEGKTFLLRVNEAGIITSEELR